jgi:2-dehydro-3-deoxyphosphogluconate aldolase/(4S)-4-hydroxy-2-oxoglutarate aldolase
LINIDFKESEMFERLKKILKFRIIPVVAINDADDSHQLADALLKGGLPCAEITFRTSAAANAIKKLSKRKDIIVGAGTTLRIEQVKIAVQNGASFIVTPGFNPKVVRYCVENNIPITPGVSTPSDIEMALESGIKIVKYFPAEAFGGIKTLKAISAPYNMMKFIPTGGIGPKNVADYLKHSSVIACGGSWMVKSKLIEEKKFEEIERLTNEAVEIVKKLNMT